MTTCTLRPARIILLTLTLGLVFAGFALAQGAPMTADRQPGKGCAPAMSVAAPQDQPDPLGLTTPQPKPNGCYYGMYDEWWKNGEICRWRNSCDGPAYHGSCPDGYDFRNSETVICYCW
jgi:hypothetical protein